MSRLHASPIDRNVRLNQTSADLERSTNGLQPLCRLLTTSRRQYRACILTPS
jgi:hypothetical protein